MLQSTQGSGAYYTTENFQLGCLVLSLKSWKPPTSLRHITLCRRYPSFISYCFIHKLTFSHQSWRHASPVRHSRWRCSCAYSLFRTAKLPKQEVLNGATLITSFSHSPFHGYFRSQNPSQSSLLWILRGCFCNCVKEELYQLPRLPVRSLTHIATWSADYSWLL